MPSSPASSPASPASRRVLDVEHAGGVATLWLDRPDARNALGRAFFEELPVVMAELSEKPAVHAIVVAARGRDFSVGLDLKEMGDVLAAGPAGGEARAAVTASHAAVAAATRRVLVEMQ
ncbi:MAG: enoyl-CoA hydratase-related protein, partial [Acidimicrobiales bacterium]